MPRVACSLSERQAKAIERDADQGNGGMTSRSWRGCLLFMAGLLVALVVACSLFSVGVSTQLINLPPVLLQNNVLWVGDRCRAYLNTSDQYTRQCVSGY